MLVLKWFNIGPGDEVIIPAYTYSATALCVLNLGAKPIMVDVKDDFTIDPNEVEKAINKNTKVIMPVDIGGWPADYKLIKNIIKKEKIKKMFHANGINQKKINRILMVSDAAHSIGGVYEKLPIGTNSDFVIFSFHSVKNITTGEGGAVCVNIEKYFPPDQIYNSLKSLSLNGQNKSAYEKNTIGGWKYDIIDQGLKINMPDICAAIGLAQIRIYNKKLLPERKAIFRFYNSFFSKKNWAILPPSKSVYSESSYHLYMLRIKGFSESMRDKLIHYNSLDGISLNVHYIPMPKLTLFKKLGYSINKYPNTLRLYSNEISLPLFNGLTNSELNTICKSIESSYYKIINDEK